MGDSKVSKTDAQWREMLSEEEYYVCRQQGTERAFTGIYWNEKRAGEYRCKCCDAALFSSSGKYDSGCGWPSFYEALDSSKILELRDTSHGMIRTEIRCARCDCHLGHVFPDGPAPTGIRYCVNSASITLFTNETGE